ncbi:hypothetical protein C8R47DRAFT_1319742, partial [Mycena vitilis]
MSERPDFNFLPLCILTNASALLIPAMAHLAMLIWLDLVDKVNIVIHLESGIFAIFTAAVCCILSNKYGVTKPVHEAAVLLSEAFWAAQWNAVFYILSIPITMGIWKATMYWGNWGHQQGVNSLDAWAIPGDSGGAFSVEKSDGLYELDGLYMRSWCLGKPLLDLIMAHLTMLIWLDPVDIVTHLASGILALFTAAICCILSNKFGVTQPLHEAAAFVLTVHIAFCFLLGKEFWAAQWSLPLYFIFSISITKICLIPKDVSSRVFQTFSWNNF